MLGTQSSTVWTRCNSASYLTIMMSVMWLFLCSAWDIFATSTETHERAPEYAKQCDKIQSNGWINGTVNINKTMNREHCNAGWNLERVWRAAISRVALMASQFHNASELWSSTGFPGGRQLCWMFYHTQWNAIRSTTVHCSRPVHPGLVARASVFFSRGPDLGHQRRALPRSRSPYPDSETDVSCLEAASWSRNAGTWRIVATK